MTSGIDDLYTWCVQNGAYGNILLEEWTGIDEFGNIIQMSDIGKSSRKKMIWKCSKGHEWSASITQRTYQKTKCRKCKRNLNRCKDTLSEWCLDNGAYGRQLISEFQGLDEQGNQYKITEIAKSSNIRILWKCSDEHEWYALVRDRVYGHNTCPICRSLLKWCKDNGDFGNMLHEEFTGLCDDGNTYNINELGSKSPRRMMWKCNKGHKWYTSIASRTSKYTKCPMCSTVGTSYPEQFLYRAILQIYPNTISRGKFQGIEYDITIPEENTCIEYSGIIWHADKLGRDQMKSDICKENNIRFIQIYAHTGQIDTEDIFDENIIIYKSDYNSIESHNKQLTEILEHILKQFGHHISEIDIEKAQTEAFNFMHNIESEQDIIEENTESTIGYQIKPEDF